LRTANRTYSCIALAISLLLLSPGAPLRSQQEPKIAVEVKVVNVLATVRDKQGQFVSTLTKDDFLLAEDGHPQSIQYFSKESDLALTLGLLVDTSMSVRRVLPEERDASYVFLDRVLREKDQAFVIDFNRDVTLDEGFTSSHKKLDAALKLLESAELNRGDRGSGGGSGDGGGGRRSRGGFGGGGTLLYDAIYLASDELMRQVQGRKAIILLTDGEDRGSKESLETAIETAQRADTVVYSILFSDEEAFGGRDRRGRSGGGSRFPGENHPNGKKVLERISRETGGRLFEVSKKQSFDQIFSSIQQELRNQYSIGYTPARTDAASSGYRKIQLTTKLKDLIVQARDGYYASK
jgi:VWFA-related protein